MASREYTTEVYKLLKKAGVTNKTDPMRGILATLLALPAEKGGGEAYYVNDFRTKLKVAVAQLTRTKGVSDVAAKTTLYRIMRKVLPKGDYRLGVLTGRSVAPALAAAAVRSIPSAPETVGRTVTRRGGALAAVSRQAGAPRKVVESVIKETTGVTGAIPATGAAVGATGKVKQVLSKGGKFGGALTGLFTVLAVNELVNMVLADKRSSRELDVQEEGMSPELEYYRQMQPFLQQEYAGSQAMLQQAFGGGAGGTGGMLRPVTGETIIGGGGNRQ